jgi:hypothetical protein
MDAIKVWHGLPATFTPPDSLGKPVPFEHRHERYINVAEVMVTLASASLVFVPSSRLSFYSHACAFALILLGLCVLYSVGFMAFLTYFYERFLYDDQTYRPWKYGLLAGWPTLSRNLSLALPLLRLPHPCAFCKGGEFLL